MWQALICDCASFGAIFWWKFIHLKSYINVICYYTLHREKKIAEISLFLLENKEQRLCLKPATSFPCFWAKKTDFHKYFCPMHCRIVYYIDIKL